MKPFRKKFWRDQEGMTAVEFALISPVMMFMIMGIIELGLMMYVSCVMESATTNVSRLGKTGFSAAGISREQTLRNMLEQRSVGLINMSDINISTVFYPTIDQIGDAEPFQDTNRNGIWDAGETFDDINGNGTRDTDMGSQGLGDANDVVVYTISYPWKITTPIIAQLFGSSGVVTLSSRTVVKNEPYDVENLGN